LNTCKKPIEKGMRGIGNAFSDGIVQWNDGMVE
jgi:hypothetical protein